MTLSEAARNEDWIYAIQEGDVGQIKIGIAKDPDERLKTLQCGNSTKLRGLAAWEGDAAHERAIHGAFAHLRVRGEWFRPTPALICFIRFMDDDFIFREDMTPEMEELVFG